MKTRMIAVALFTFLSFTALSGTANGRVKNISDLSYPENPAALECQGIQKVQLMKDAVNLDGWIVNRDIWEQAGEEMMTENSLVESTTLEEWVNGRENWEQHGELKAIEAAFTGSSILDEWITGIESWEQE